MKTILTVIASLLLTGVSFGETINVPADFPTIQEAINAANDDDEIIVAPGTYTASGTPVINFSGKRIRIKSNPELGGAATTILQNLGGTSSVVYAGNQEEVGTELDGFTIVNGSGGIYSFFSLHIANCIIESNGSTSSNTGGIVFAAFSNSVMTVENCIIRNNQSSGGAGIRVTGGQLNLIDCEIYDNTSSGRGAGVSINSGYGPTVTITGCDIHHNTTTNAAGGINIENNTDVTIDNCRIRENSASYGGGGIRWNSSNSELSITNSTICGNTPTNTYGSITLDETNCVSDSCDDQDGDGIINECDADTFYVPADFANIQDAIDYAGDNDTIMVNAGTYTGTGDSVIDTKGKAIIIQANGGTPASTILDGEGKRRVVVSTSGEDETTIIKGFTITNGYSPYGSGVYCHSSSPQILSCFIVGNDAVASSGIRYGGGGVCGYKSSLSLIECLIAYNTCSYSDGNTGGGGISLTFGNGNPLLQECVIRDNDGLEYGGLHASQGCSPILDDCIIKDNSGTGVTTYGSNMSLENCEITGHAAGGILVSVYSSTTPTNITNCMISDNQAGRGVEIRNPLGGLIEGCLIENHNSTSMTDGGAGGGIRSTYSGPLDIKDCIVRNNTASSGGGIYLDDDAVGEIQNCIVTGNSATSSWTGSGGGMLIGSATLDNCTVSNNFARSSGGGIQCAGDLALINCTIESNETISNSRFPAIRSRNLIIDGCTFSGNESFYGGPCDIGVLDSCLFRGLNNISGSVKTWRGLISLDPMTETSLGDLLNVDNYSNVNLQFDIDLPETSPPLLSDGVVITNGCLSIENSSSSLLDAQVGEAFSLMQADVSSSGFGSILFPSMPQGHGLRLIEQSRNSRSVDLAVEVIEVDTPEFGNPFAGDLDSPPTKLRSADVDGDGKDELAVLFGGTPGYVVIYDVFEDGPPVERTTLTTAVGNEPVDLAVSDIDGDGDEDVLVANQADGTISLLISTSASPFGVMTIVVPGGSPVCLSATNWDGDSELDAVVGVDVPGSSKDEFRLIIDLISGGTTGPAFLIPYVEDTSTSDPPTVLDGSDRNGWGFVGGTQSGQILKGTPGSTTLLELIDLETQAITSILTQDLDDNGGDGLLDVAASSGDEGTMYLFQGLTSGFNEGIPITVSLPVTDFTALDADGDQDVDFILVAPGSATEPMTLLRNDGTTSALRVLAGRTWSKQIIASNNSPGSIASGTLDPKDEEDDWVIGGGTTLGLRGDPNSTIEKTILNSISADCNADLNHDNIVDINDLLIILSNYGENDSGDIDGDGTSGLDDILIFLASFGTEC